MAKVTMTLTANFTPAYHALVAMAQEIAEACGEDRAMKIVQAAMSSDIEAFVVFRADEKRPTLRLVHSAA